MKELPENLKPFLLSCQKLIWVFLLDCTAHCALGRCSSWLEGDLTLCLIHLLGQYVEILAWIPCNQWVELRLLDHLSMWESSIPLACLTWKVIISSWYFEIVCQSRLLVFWSHRLLCLLPLESLHNALTLRILFQHGQSPCWIDVFAQSSLMRVDLNWLILRSLECPKI